MFTSWAFVISFPHLKELHFTSYAEMYTATFAEKYTDIFTFHFYILFIISSSAGVMLRKSLLPVKQAVECFVGRGSQITKK